MLTISLKNTPKNVKKIQSNIQCRLNALCDYNNTEYDILTTQSAIFKAVADVTINHEAELK